MSRHESELTDAQWVYIAPLLPEVKASPKGAPKPIPNRPVFEGILWVLRSGARWKDLPDRYPSPSTCWRRLRAWEEQDVWLKAWRALLKQLDERGQLDWAETFADGSFARIARIEKNHPPRMAVHCVATRGDGRSNAPSLGGAIFVDWSCVGNIISRCIRPLSMWLVCGSSSDSYETASKQLS